MLVFLEYIFHFFINEALSASNSVDRAKKVLKMIFNDGSFSFFLLFFFGLFVFFFLTHFYVLTDLKYTGRLIASSLSAFISKIQSLVIHKLALGTL